MKILVLGSGGREHVLCWSLKSSPLVDALYCAPGNAGIARDATCLDLDPMDFDAVSTYCQTNEIDLVVVGPEAPLVAGIVDRLEADGFACFGPTAAAARLEGSKTFMKELCDKYGVPTAQWAKFDTFEPARAYIEKMGAPIVVKADGLAAGKGVIVATSTEEAVEAAQSMFDGAFGDAGAEIIIEECMVGEEASFFVLVDGKNALPLATAQDHKRIGEGDTGPNTGGMGAYSPAPVMTEALCDDVMQRIVQPLVDGLAAEDAEFKGLFYAGIMLTADGPKLLEVNTRFGDPECQVVLPRLKSDLLLALMASRDGELGNFSLRWHDDAALCVVMATEGYPGAYGKGSVIAGFEDAEADDAVVVFHAGTKEVDGNITAAGGRVLGVTALGPTIADAQSRAYAAVDKISWPEGYCRRDIGWRAVGS
ncbi:MAG: phosphoribosylamine--glycine ligase [Alphaproteobacteria bacterium]|nr:phosphoribosylamine--glycine ligase [Alphaproteobacteria bacterium]